MGLIGYVKHELYTIANLTAIAAFLPYKTALRNTAVRDMLALKNIFQGAYGRGYKLLEHDPIMDMVTA